MPRRTASEAVPTALKPHYDEIVALTDAFCAGHLTPEYAQVCRQMVAALARKRPSPLLGGKANSWAAAIAYTAGSVNFLFDKSQTPYMRADELAAAFGLSKSTVGNKANQIKKILDNGIFDPNWTLPSKIEQNPLAWLISVDGFMLDARCAPRHIQEIAYEKGLIPYIPDEETEQE